MPFTFVATVSAIYYTRRDAGVRRHRPAHVHDGPGADRGGDHAAHQGDHARCTSTASRADMDPILAIARRSTASSSSRTPARRTAPSTRAGAPAAWATWAASASTRARTSAPTAKAAWSSTDNAEYARTIRMLRDWGAEKKYQHVLKGYNFRLEGIQGAVLRVKLRHLEKLDRGAPRRGRALRRAAAPAAACRRPRRCRTTGTSITSTPSARPQRAAWQEALHGAGHPDRHPLPDPGAPAARVRRPRLRGRPVPALRARGAARCCRCRCFPN